MRRPVWFALAVVASCAGVCVGLASVPAGATSPLAARPGPSSPVVAARAPIGALTLGRVTPSGTSQCLNDQMWIQAFVDPDKPPTRIPFAGVITSVSSFANANPNGKIQAVFLAPTPITATYTVVQRSAVLALAPGQLNTFPVRIPVDADETFGLRAVSGQPRCEELGGVVDQTFVGPLDASATSWSIDGSHGTRLVDLSAVWEPDQDGDGFGDVSQDGCPQLAAVHDPCPAPVTTIGKAPKKRISTHKVKIKFSSDVAGSTFGCSIDGRAFKPCHSPFKGKFLPGTHTVRILATTPVGVPATSPVTVQFKVKPKR